MKFTVFSHAALLLEHRGVRALIDPWLLDDCYDHGWALLCERPDLLDQLPQPHWLLYSHAHPDHLHVTTLRVLAARFGAELPILIPRLLTGRMRSTLRGLGFQNIREAPPARPVHLGEDFTVTFHPIRADDSLQVFRGGGLTLVNTNDCQLEGRALDSLSRRYRDADFYFGHYSIGDGYPFRLEGIAPRVTEAAAAAPSARFRRQVEAFEARHAVPTASGARFATVENQEMNRWTTTLVELEARSEFPELSILYPGDGWSDAAGWIREPTNRTRYEGAVAALRNGSTPSAKRRPTPPVGTIEISAKQRFEHMFASIPRLLRRRMSVLGFWLEDLERGLTVDWEHGRLQWGGTVCDAPHFRLGAAHFMYVCRALAGWTTLHVASRFTVHGWEVDGAVQSFLPISLLYGLGYFDRHPLSYVGPRLFEAVWAHRSEVVDLLLRPRGEDEDRSWVRL